MTKELEYFYLFYVARLVILAETETYKVRHYEDNKISIALKRSIFPDDTIVINLKGLNGSPEDTRVFEVALCPLPFSQRDMNQIYLKGCWEDYLVENLFETAIEKLKYRHRGIDDFMKFLCKYGPTDDEVSPVCIGEIDDAELFNNLAQE